MLEFVHSRIQDGRLDARIEFVFSNRERGEAEGSDRYFDLVNAYGLPLSTLSSAEFRKTKGGRFADHREEYDGLVMEGLGGFNPDVCVLAGYMLIASGSMCRRFPLLNLHPALPDGPIGTWQEVIWELIESRASRTGAMVHLATEEVDRGPVASYCTVPITGGVFAPLWEQLVGQSIGGLKASRGEDLELFQAIRRAEYRIEPYLLFETLCCVAEGKIVAKEGQLFDPAGKLLSESQPTGFCLDREVGLALEAESGTG